MADIRSSLLGRVLLDEGHIALEPLLECLELQEQLHREGKPTPRLGALLVEKGYLQEDALQAILSRQKKGQKTTAKHTTRRIFSTSNAHPDSHGNIEFGEFLPEKILGEDAFSSSFLATHKATGALVLLRVQKDTGADAPSQEFFGTHANAAQKLIHAHLQRVLAVGHVDKQHFYAAEFLEGVSLRRLMAGENRLPWAWAARIALQIAEALTYCHKYGFVHGEVRPSNILIVPDGSACLCGYGSSAHALSNLHQMYRSGDDAPFYVAPEQVLPEQPITSSADVFSLGATLYRAVTGVPPFNGEDMEEVLLRISQEEPVGAATLVPTLPPALDSLLTRMLMVEPERRIDALGVWRALALLIHDPSPDLRELQAYQNSLMSRYFSTAGIDANPAEKRNMRSGRKPGSLWPASRAYLVPFLALLCVSFGTSWLYNKTQHYRIYAAAADKAYAAGDLLRAVEELELAVKERENDSRLIKQLIGVAEEAGDFTAAEKAQTQLLLLPAENTAAGWEHLADLQLWQKRYEEAVGNYQIALGMRPVDTIGIRGKLASALQWMGRYRDSAEEFRALSREEPKNFAYILELARSENYAQQYSRALKEYEKYLALAPQNQAALFEYAECLAAAGKFAQAAEVYQRYAKQNGDSPDAQLARARNLLWAGDYPAAVTAFEALLATDTNKPQILRSLSNAYQGAGNLDKAIAMQEALVLLQNATFDERLNLAHLYQGRQRFADAVKLLGVLAKERPGDKKVWLDAGRTKVWAGELAGAVPYLQKAYALDEGDAALKAEYANLLLWTKQPEKALPLLEQLVQADKADISMRIDLARLYLAAGEREKAHEVFTALTVEGDFPAENLLALAEMEIQFSTPEGQLGQYRTWLAKHPDDRAAIRRFAELLRAAGRHAEALPLYRKLTEFYPEDQKLLLQASEEAGWAGQPQEELKFLERLDQIQKNAGATK